MLELLLQKLVIVIKNLEQFLVFYNIEIGNFIDRTSIICYLKYELAL